ncbi:unnamed protein product [Gadus morhua 'NCC']
MLFGAAYFNVCLKLAEFSTLVRPVPLLLPKRFSPLSTRPAPPPKPSPHSVDPSRSSFQSVSPLCRPVPLLLQNRLPTLSTRPAPPPKPSLHSVDPSRSSSQTVSPLCDPSRSSFQTVPTSKTGRRRRGLSRLLLSRVVRVQSPGPGEVLELGVSGRVPGGKRFVKRCPTRIPQTQVPQATLRRNRHHLVPLQTNSGLVDADEQPVGEDSPVPEPDSPVTTSPSRESPTTETVRTRSLLVTASKTTLDSDTFLLCAAG